MNDVNQTYLIGIDNDRVVEVPAEAYEPMANVGNGVWPHRGLSNERNHH